MKVKDLLDKLKGKHKKFDFIRLKDARSSRGKGASAQVADFQVFTAPHHIALEVKEIDHNFRMPQKNLSQIPKMTRRAMAGGLTCIMVFSIPLEKWYLLSLSWVRTRKKDPSYDMSGLPKFDNEEEAWDHFCLINNIKYRGN